MGFFGGVGFFVCFFSSQIILLSSNCVLVANLKSLKWRIYEMACLI